MKHNFKNLEIWKRSRKLVKEVYLITQAFPSEEKFGLISQLRRAAISVPSNIAEGCSRGTPSQFNHFLNIAIGSNCEVETQLYLSFDLEFISEVDLNKLVKELTEIRKMIIGFQERLR